MAGLGRWLIDALQRRDYPVVQGGVLLVATMIILVNLLVDLLYGVVNPRIRHKKGPSCHKLLKIKLSLRRYP
nr:Dipeptide transport system permease protein dppB [Klebsiella pneumoniae]